MSDIQNYEMLIDGDWVGAADGALFESVNPTNGEIWSRVPEATSEDVKRAVEAAHRAFTSGPWATMTPTERGKCLRRLAELLADKSEELGRIESIDTGKMLKETRWQAKYIAEFFQFYAGCADKISGRNPAHRQAGYVRLHQARAAGRRGRCRPLELAAFSRRGEDRAGTGGRQHRRAEGVRTRLCRDARVRQTDRGSGLSPGRGQYRDRAWRSLRTRR